jgi:hypothetical protein
MTLLLTRCHSLLCCACALQASTTSTLTASLHRGNTISSVTSDVSTVATSLAAAAAGPGAAPPERPPKYGGNKGTHALRTLFNVAHRLADSLGQAWIHVVQVLNTLEAVLAAGKVGYLLFGACEAS